MSHDRSKTLAPSPEVQYLPTLFRRIQQGDIRMPAFQRGFVWTDGQIVELLESIYQGFPIGSILLWRVDKALLKVERSDNSYFPDVQENYPTTFVLDGLQRLSSLYATFHFDPRIHPERFNLHFDLATRQFVPARERNPTSLPLKAVFRPNDFIAFHSKLSGLENGAKLISEAVGLLATFQEYMVPLVTIVGREVGDVVSMFERVNSTGTRLGAVDFMRAVTWSEDFDLNHQLDLLRVRASEHGFEIPHDTLVKVLAISLGFSPSAETMLGMRNLDAPRLQRGIEEASKLILRVIGFLKTHLSVHSYDLVPYEAQFMAIAGFFSRPGEPTRPQVGQLARWYWTASLNEDMQGRSEHQVSRIVQTMQQLRDGDVRRLRGRLTLTESVLKDRRFRWGAALSSALASMLARKRCRSLVTGEEISTEEYMAGNAGSNFLPFVAAKDVSEAVGKDIPAGKVVANVIVASSSDLPELRRGQPGHVIRALRRSRPNDWLEVLDSQMIPESAAEALLKGRPSTFLQQRAEALLKYGQTLAFQA